MKIITARNGVAIRCYTDEEPPMQVEPKPVRVRKPTVRKNRWLEAESKPEPERKDLTRRQWAEYGDLLRMIRNLGFTNARSCSLQDLRDVHKSTIKLQTDRLVQSLN